MADPEMDEDLFADLYDGEDIDTTPAVKTEPTPVVPEPQNDSVNPLPTTVNQDSANEDATVKMEAVPSFDPQAFGTMQGVQGMMQQNGGFGAGEHERPFSIKEDGKMFIGGLNWETTDQSLKDYFSQFGEVLECTVMRDGATGRSRGFGFLTFKDPKVVNTVMVKEHSLDGKLIDPKRAIPRDEQEKTAKIFVGGVSQEATDADFRGFFEQFGNVLDATLMMDKDTGRPRGFGFVTFDGDDAVDRTLSGPLQICGKPIEVKRAQPRGNMRDEEGGRGGKFGRHGKQDNFGGNFNQQNQAQTSQENRNGQNTMSPAMMGAYWQRMQQYFQMMQQQMAANMGANAMNPMAAMQNNPAMMQQMMARQGMNPAMMQNMGAMQGYPGMPQTGSPMNNGGGSPMQNRAGLNPQEQMMFEQRKYEQQAMSRMQQGSFSPQNTWEGMYDDVPAPAGMQGGNGRGGFAAGRGRGGRGSQGPTPQPVAQAPANAPTGPKNAGRPGANYRGGGRGAHRGFHPYARGGG